jgi:hypothetical protein
MKRPIWVPVGGIQIKGSKNAPITAPHRMKGLRLPHRVRALSETAPASGSKIAPTTFGTANAMPNKRGSIFKAML